MTIGQLQRTLPSQAYRSEEIFVRERERIFAREWICVGREHALAACGGVRVLDVLGESVILARTKAGALRAHYNVCRHRGAGVCAEAGARPLLGSGLTPGGTIRCPYHSWTYDLDGRLLSAPHLAEAADLRREDFPLHAVGVSTWGGRWPTPLGGRDGGLSRCVPKRGRPQASTRRPLTLLCCARRAGTSSSPCFGSARP